MRKIFSIFAVGTVMVSATADAAEYEIGEARTVNGMTVAAVYLQPVKMYPEMPMAGGADIHIEADIHAAKDNSQGFAEGSWIPYLTISYILKKQGSDWQTSGSFMAMVANDGPHYGQNVKLDGVGEYEVSYHIDPPILRGITRHTDKETGVAPWWPGFDVSWSFKYIGVGKKGGY